MSAGGKVVRPSGAERVLVAVLRAFGALDLLALGAVLLPRPWMAAAHVWLGLGTLPDAPLVGYLARSAAALYALHGALVVFLSFDVRRYRPVITFLAAAALVHGAIMAGIDFAEGMPRPWALAEGPCFAATGAVVLLLQRRARPA
jgi:hypothetical protein